MARTSKKQKELTPEKKLAQALVPVEEQPYPIPENWCWTTIEIINEFNSSTLDPRKKPTDYYELYSVPSCENDYPEIIQGSDIKSSKQVVAKDDILICKINPRINRVWKVSQYTDNPLLASSEWIVVRNQLLNPNYLMWFFKTPVFREYMLSNVSGVGGSLMRAQPKYVKTYPVPIPPLAEQQRIVDRIEGLFSKLDEAKEKAQTVVDAYEDRRSTILHMAFTGELTAEWRSINQPFAAECYLKQIQDRQNEFCRNEFKFWKDDTLPEGWVESKIGNCLYYAGRIGWKGLKAEEYTTCGPILLSVFNLNDGDEVSYDHINHISKERYEESPEIMVQEGDILLTKDGAGIGKVGYVKSLPQKATINSSLLLIRPGEAAISKYVYYLLLGPSLQRIVKERITGSATPHLFQRDIKDFVIPIPPIDEQRQIVDRLESILSELMRSKLMAEQTIEVIDVLKKTLLNNAFRGKLGTNDPKEEPATVLLKQLLK